MSKERRYDSMTIYDIEVLDQDNKKVSLSDYQGDVLLIINTATHCGFTPTYKDIEATYEKYQDKGFEVLDFPCNQFAHQAPEEVKEISAFCSLKFGTTFPRFAKIDVNGPKASPLYKYLEGEKGFEGFDPKHKLTKILMEMNAKAHKDWDKKPSIKWNFTKFLVGRNGNVIARYEPTASFEEIHKAIEKALEEKVTATPIGAEADKEAVKGEPITKLTLAVLTGCPHCLMAEKAFKKYGLAYDKADWNSVEGKKLIKSYGIEEVPVLLIPSKNGVSKVEGDEDIVAWVKAHAVK